MWSKVTIWVYKKEQISVYRTLENLHIGKKKRSIQKKGVEAYGDMEGHGAFRSMWKIQRGWRGILWLVKKEYFLKATVKKNKNKKKPSYFLSEEQEVNLCLEEGEKSAFLKTKDYMLKS